MKLLVLDYISYSGHKNFNKVHIESLIRLGVDVELMGRKGQFDNIDNVDMFKVYNMPEWLFKNYPLPSISFRLQGIASLIWVKKHIKCREYDAILVLTYDILSLFTFRISNTVILVNHNNVPQLWSKVKYNFTKWLPKDYIHIALNEEMEQRLKLLFPLKSVFHVPHGICPPSLALEKPTFIKSSDSFLFCPVNRNYDGVFVTELFENKSFLDFLEKKKLFLLVKDNVKITVASKNIIKVSSSLPLAEYNYLLQNSVAVILPYDKQFKYRCSGIFFECVARQKPIIATEIDAMKIYQQNVDMRLFSTADELIIAIDYYLNNKAQEGNLSVFNPQAYWDVVIKSLLKRQ